MILKISLTQEQGDTLVRTATGLGAATLKTMNTQDLIRHWIDQGCPLFGDGYVLKTPEQAKAAAAALAARKGKQPILKPSAGKKS